MLVYLVCFFFTDSDVFNDFVKFLNNNVMLKQIDYSLLVYNYGIKRKYVVKNK